MANIAFSKEQEDIFEYAEHGVLNMIVQAVAGAGKTTTLVECANRIENSKKILLLAHNRSTKDTLKERIGDKPNVMICTLHGLGWRFFVEHFDFTPTIEEDKYRNYINKNINVLGSEEYQRLKKPLKLQYKSNVFELIDKSRSNLKQSEKEITKMAKKKYGMSLIADECAFVAKVLKWGQSTTDVVDYMDLLWFPSEYGYFTKKYLADIIMLDEAQDASLAQQDVVSRCFKRNTRLFAFGDEDQCINSWAGSDTEAFNHLKDSDTFRREAKELPLTTNYRCGKNIIEYAKHFVNNNIHARDDAPDGEVNYDMHLDDVKNGDMILCRNSAPLMKVFNKGMQLAKKMYFRGENMGKNLQSAIDCANGNTIPEIIFSLKQRLISMWDYLNQDENLDPKETMLDPKIVTLYDTIKTIENLPKTVENRNDFEKFIKDVFSDEGKDGIQLSTIHKAKGLEADNVFVICPSLIPSSLATLDWQKKEEQHLLYVMATRPKLSLNFISEKEIVPFKCFQNVNAFYNELLIIKQEVNESKKEE